MIYVHRGRGSLINYTFVNCRKSQLGMFLGAKNGRGFLTEIHLLPYLIFFLAFLSFLYLYYSVTASTVRCCAH